MILDESTLLKNSVKITLEDKEFSKALVRYYSKFSADLSKIIRTQARLVAVNLTFQTQPFGGSRPTQGKQADEQISGKQLGDGAIQRDINYLYTTPERVFYMIRETSQAAAKGFVRLMKTRQFLRARQMLDRLQITGLRSVDVGDFDGGSLHKTRLQPIPSRPRIKKTQKPELIVPDQSMINSYIKQIQKRVGMAKAGWAHCAQQLGGTSGQTSTDVEGKQQVMVPRWVKQHAGSPSIGKVVDRSFARPNAYVEMTNEVPWIDKCLNAGQMQAALDIQREKMEKAIKKADEHNAKKLSNQLLGF
jgi:hypothetical protein